ncbi:MAG: DUF4907 domain-containing protein [Crocinitomicaceae bacterium]
MNRFLFFLLVALLLSCSNDEVIEETSEELGSTTTTANDRAAQESESSTYGIQSKENKTAYSARIIFTDSLGWGYQIFDGNTMLINQLHIPSIQGNRGFKSREAAQLTANFILYKLTNGVFPPTVDEKELDSLGVL